MTSRGRSTSPRRRRHTRSAPTGFIAFYTEQYQDLSKQYEDENGRKASVTEISKIAAQKYSKLDASIKAKYSADNLFFFKSDGSRRRQDLDAVVPECAEAKVTVKNATKDATKDATKNSTKNATPENEAKDVAENVTRDAVEQDEQGTVKATENEAHDDSAVSKSEEAPPLSNSNESQADADFTFV